MLELLLVLVLVLVKMFCCPLAEKRFFVSEFVLFVGLADYSLTLFAVNKFVDFRFEKIPSPLN
jgi:hypothetical protein